MTINCCHLLQRRQLYAKHETNSNRILMPFFNWRLELHRKGLCNLTAHSQHAQLAWKHGCTLAAESENQQITANINCSAVTKSGKPFTRAGPPPASSHSQVQMQQSRPWWATMPPCSFQTGHLGGFPNEIHLWPPLIWLRLKQASPNVSGSLKWRQTKLCNLRFPRQEYNCGQNPIINKKCFTEYNRLNRHFKLCS